MTERDRLISLGECYPAVWNTRDDEGMAALFSEPSAMFHGGHLAVTSNSTAVADDLRARFAAIEADGFDRTEIDTIEVEMNSSTFAQLHLRGLRRLRADGSVTAFDAVYLCGRADQGWRLSVGAAGDAGWRSK